MSKKKDALFLIKGVGFDVRAAPSGNARQRRKLDRMWYKLKAKNFTSTNIRLSEKEDGSGELGGIKL